MSLIAPPVATVTLAANAVSGTFAGDLSAYNIQVGMELYIGSRAGRAGNGKIITAYAQNGSTGGTFTVAEAFGATAYTAQPFVIDNFAAPTSIAAQNNLGITLLVNALRKFFGISTTLDQASKTLPRDRGAGAGTFFQDLWQLAGRTWFGVEHRTVGAVERLLLRAYPDGTTPVESLDVDGSTGGVKTLSAEGSVAAAATCDIASPRTDRVLVTGSTGITSLGTGKWQKIEVRFAAALTITHNAASLILPGAANLTVAAGDTARFASDGSGNWRLISFQPAGVAAFLAADRTKLSGLSLGANLLANPDFESGLDGWTAAVGNIAGVAISVATGNAAVSGSQYAVIDLGQTGPIAGTGPSLGRTSAKMPIDPNSWNFVGTYVWADVAAPAQSIFQRMQFYRADGTVASTGVATVGAVASGVASAYNQAGGRMDWRSPALTTAPQLMGGLIKPPADATSYDLTLIVINTTTTARYHYFDAAAVRRAAGALDIEPKAITAAQMADMAINTIRGRASAGAGPGEDLTGTQVRAILGLATTDAPTFAGLTATGPVRVPSYTVATLPTAGTRGRLVDCSNGRMATGAGAIEAAGSGTGGLVEDNGTAWKVAGTNVTVSA